MMQLASLRSALELGDSSLVGNPAAARALADAATARAGAPTPCELRDAALTLQPALPTSQAVQRYCDGPGGAPVAMQPDALSPTMEFAEEVSAAFASREAALAHAKAIAEGACHFLGDFPSLASRATAVSASQCTVRLPRRRALFLHPTTGGGGGAPATAVVVPSGAHLTVEADGDADGGVAGGEGADGGRAVLDAAGRSRFFTVAGGARLSLRGVHLRRGRALLSGGGAVLLLPGGTLDALDCTFAHNKATLGSGGAIASRGAALKLHRVRFERNEATLRGGALSHMSHSAAAAAEELLHIGLHSSGGSGMAATAALDAVVWEGNRAGRAGGDVMLCAGATLSPRPTEGTCAISECAEQSAASKAGTAIFASSIDAEGGGTAAESPPAGAVGRLQLSAGSMMGLECASEGLELLEIEGMERDALRLLEQASVADPFSPHAFTFHLNFLYSHAMDAAAAARLAAFARARPDHPSLGQMRAMIANSSAPMLRQRGQTLNGQVARMRARKPVVVDFASRLEAQDATTEAFVLALQLSPTDGELWNDLGTSLFFAGELAEASLVYAAGAQRAPTHAGLKAEAARAAAFPLAPPSADQISVDLFGAGHAGKRTFDAEFETVPLPAGSSYGSRHDSEDLQAGADVFGAAPTVFVSKRPLLPKQTCDRYIAAAEAWAARSGGWTTSRHYSVATTDIPLVSLPELLPSFNEALHTLLLPALAACYPEAAPHASALQVLDCFLVRYDASKQSSLPTHTDQSLLSFTIALNDPSDYEGGGTWFQGLGRAVDAPSAGHAVLFPGKVEHGGHPITSGVRYIIVLFMGYRANRMSHRTAGYALERIQGARSHASAADAAGQAPKDEL